ncbi:hypothetical protein RYX36_009407 [Vicia faba]
MGFLRRLFGGKKHHNPPPETAAKKDKKTWSLVKNSTRDKTNPVSLNSHKNTDTSASFAENYDANKHAIAVAAATAAVAEAALAAAHAAAEVVRLTSSTDSGHSAVTPQTPKTGRSRSPEVVDAAVKIQSAFRGYLARRALRALKALVKLQALVRGHIVRKQTADMLRRMQTLVRLQSRARANRMHVSDSMHSFKSSLSRNPIPGDYEHRLRVHRTKCDGSSILKRCSSNANFRDMNLERARFGSNWLDGWMEENPWSQSGDTSSKIIRLDDEKSDKILEVDTWKPHLNSHHSTSASFQHHHHSSCDYNNENFTVHESPSKHLFKPHNSSLSSLKHQKDKEEVASSRTTDYSPQALTASSRLESGLRRGPFTPTKSESSWSFFNGYSGCPSYMANTQSSRAKVRSQSAPRQRLEFERNSVSTTRSIQGL